MVLDDHAKCTWSDGCGIFSLTIQYPADIYKEYLSTFFVSKRREAFYGATTQRSKLSCLRTICHNSSCSWNNGVRTHPFSATKFFWFL